MSTVTNTGINNQRIDHQAISDLIADNCSVLDVGCGDGGLLDLLEKRTNIHCRGIELSQSGVSQSVSRGLSVIQGDADRDLVYYPDNAFDYVILSQTIQAMNKPREVLQHLLRIGDKIIVSLPNFGHWKVRKHLLLKGQMPVTEHLPYSWYDTPNIHFCTIRDFVNLCDELDAKIERAIALNAGGQRIGFRAPWWFWNVFGEQAIFLLTNRK